MVGVDMGTSSTRVVVLDEDGRCLGAARHAQPGAGVDCLYQQ